MSHAQSLAALLDSLMRYTGGVDFRLDLNPQSAVTISIQFRSGRIRVISNYGVLAQGFDAPSVRAVYVTSSHASARTSISK